MAISIRSFFTNIICGLIPSRDLRHRVRVFLNNPSCRLYIRFVREWAEKNRGGVRKIKISLGCGCQNLVVLLNDSDVFKFPLHSGGNELAQRDLRIYSALRTITPIPMPSMEIIHWRGLVVRRYEFIRGKLLCDFPTDSVLEHREHLAKQLANFMYVIGCADPTQIRDIKPSKTSRPGFMYGWFHNDIGQNFLMDDDMNIICFLDWENTQFCDFRESLRHAERFWNKNGYRGLMTDVLSQYSRLYYSSQGQFLVE